MFICVDNWLLYCAAAIALDEYHWIKRWDDIILDMKSKEAVIFKGYMPRAINAVSNDKYQDKEKQLAESLKCNPTVKEEILAECNTSRPSEEAGRKAINTVINFLYKQIWKSLLLLPMLLPKQAVRST